MTEFEKTKELFEKIKKNLAEAKFAEAKKWYKKSAEQDYAEAAKDGHAKAQYNSLCVALFNVHLERYKSEKMRRLSDPGIDVQTILRQAPF